jgi:hypothetical protein
VSIPGTLLRVQKAGREAVRRVPRGRWRRGWDCDWGWVRVGVGLGVSGSGGAREILLLLKAAARRVSQPVRRQRPAERLETLETPRWRGCSMVVEREEGEGGEGGRRRRVQADSSAGAVRRSLRFAIRSLRGWSGPPDECDDSAIRAVRTLPSREPVSTSSCVQVIRSPRPHGSGHWRIGPRTSDLDRTQQG